MSTTPWTLVALLDLAPGYVFGGLDAAERAVFEQGLASPAFGAALEAEVAALRVTRDVIVREGAVTPPPALRDALQARIAEEVGTQHAARVAGDVVSAAATPAGMPAVAVPTPRAPVARTSPTSRAVRVTPLKRAAIADEGARPRSSTAGWYAAAVLIAGLAATAYFAFDVRHRVRVLEAEARDKAALVRRLESKLNDKDRLLATLLAGRGSVTLVTLDAAAPTGPGMQLFWNRRDGKAVVNAYGLAQVVPGRAYMLWMMRDGTPVPVQLFTPDENGRALVVDVELPNTTTGVTLFAVSEESAQGAAAPTMTPFLTGQVGGGDRPGSAGTVTGAK